jgi:plasmid stabilization system protein ParE
LRVVFSEQAEKQLADIQAAFREVSRGLAEKFAVEVQSAVWRLELFPESGFVVPKARRVVLRRSRYLMLYEIRRDQVYITKLVHQKQRPSYGVSSE